MVSRERDACTWITSEVWEGEGSIYKLGLWGGGGGEAEIIFFFVAFVLHRVFHITCPIG